MSLPPLAIHWPTRSPQLISPTYFTASLIQHTCLLSAPRRGHRKSTNSTLKVKCPPLGPSQGWTPFCHLSVNCKNIAQKGLLFCLPLARYESPPRLSPQHTICLSGLGAPAVLSHCWCPSPHVWCISPLARMWAPRRLVLANTAPSGPRQCLTDDRLSKRYKEFLKCKWRLYIMYPME